MAIYHDARGGRHGDVSDATNVIRIVQETQPDEIYSLVAQSQFAGLLRNATRLMPMDWGHCVFSRPFAFSV
jgi:hypothetical protein